jgi:hypothetical protein
MMRIVIWLLFGTLLAACSGSNRVEDIVPAWANTPPSRPAAPYVTRKQQFQDVSKPVAESGNGSPNRPDSQEPKKAEVRYSEE